MTNDAIQPCPFCGSTGGVPGGLVPWVQCDECEASGPQRNTEAEAIAAWNARAMSADRGEAREYLICRCHTDDQRRLCADRSKCMRAEAQATPPSPAESAAPVQPQPGRVEGMDHA